MSSLRPNSFDDLDRLSSVELHHRAVDVARERHDVKFFARLLEYIPEAEAMSGNLAEAYADIGDMASWLHDYVHGDGTLDDALRPVYIDYLQQHEAAAPSADDAA